MKVPLMSGSARSSSRRRGSIPTSARWCRRRKCSRRRRPRSEADMTTADMVKVGREIMEGKGICLTCHTIGKTGALRFPDLAGIGAQAQEPRARPERCRLPRAVAVRTDGLRRAGIPAGDAAGQPAADRPHRSGDPLRDRGPPDAWRHADGHDEDDPPLLRRRGRTGAGCRLPRLRDAPDQPQPRPRKGRSAHEHLRSSSPSSPCFGLPSLPPHQSADVGRRLVGGDLRAAPVRIHARRFPPRSSRSTWGSSRSRSWRTCRRARSGATKSPGRSSGS